MGYYGITFGMANLSDDLFTNFIISSVIGEKTLFFFSAVQDYVKRYFLGFRVISVLEVGFYFFICVLESEFSACFI